MSATFFSQKVRTFSFFCEKSCRNSVLSESTDIEYFTEKKKVSTDFAEACLQVFSGLQSFDAPSFIEVYPKP